MAGSVNTYFGTLVDQPSPCIADTMNASSSSGDFGSCIMWLLIGLVIGSVAFDKKGKLTA